MKKIAILFALLCAPSLYGQAWSGILAPARAVDWSGVGVPGGIPSAGWAQCTGGVIAAYGTSGAPASPATINTRIAGCPANTYVQLGNGNFYLNSGIVMKSGVVLRGGGPDKTFIFLSGIDPCGGIGAAICFMGLNFAYNTPPPAANTATFTGTNSVTGVYTSGATSLRLTNIGATGIQNGDYIYLDQDDDPAVANGFLVCTNKTLTPPCSLEDGSPGRNGNRRTQNLIVKVTAGCASSCTGAGPFDVTIPAPGLIGNNWRTSQNPGAWFPGHNNTMTNAGVEGLSIDQTATGSGNTGGITFFNAAEDWVYNVRSIRAHRNHVWFWQGANITVLSNYIYDSYNASSQSYGVESFIGSRNLVANNIFQHSTTPIVLGPSIGSAYVHNFGIDNFVAQGTFNITQSQMTGCPGACVGTFTYSAYTNINGGVANTLPFSIHGLAGGSQFNADNAPIANLTGSTFQIAYATGTNNGPTVESATGLVSNGTLYPTVAYHDSGVNYNLIEGNIGAMVYADVFHGSGNANTQFRNYWVGFEKSKFGARLAGDLRSYQRYQNLLGNVLGRSGTHTAYENYSGCVGCSGLPVLSIGFGGGPDSGVTVSDDTQVRSTMMRFGNYDVNSGAIRWCGNSGNTGWSTTCASTSEVPTGLADGYANSVPASESFPASFIFASQPSWYVSAYATVHWPAIGAGVTGGNAIAPDLFGTTTAPAGLAYPNPAELCYLNSPLDSNYPLALDRGMLLFNANTCYSGAAGPPLLSLSPSPADFGSRPISTTSSPVTITVTNIGGSNEVLSTPYFTHTNTTEWANSGGSCLNGSVIAPGGSCTTVWVFTPSALGARADTLTIQGTVNGTDSFTGTGTTAPIPVVTLGPRTANFGNVATGTTGTTCNSTVNPCVFTLQNTGTATLTITSITSSSSTVFPLSANTCGAFLNAGSSCTFQGAFAPVAPGLQSATITLTTNASSSPDTIALSGTGFTPVSQPPPAPAQVIFLSQNLPPQPVINGILMSGCAANNKCNYLMSCSQCSSTTLLYVDGVQMPQSYSNGGMNFSARLADGTHGYLAVNVK